MRARGHFGKAQLQSKSGSETVPIGRSKPPATSPPQSRLNATVVTTLLDIESAAIALTKPDELDFLFANEARRIINADLIFCASTRSDQLEIAVVSGVANVDPTSPVVSILNGWLKSVQKEHAQHKPHEFDLTKTGVAGCDLQDYAARHAIWQPTHVHGEFSDRGLIFISSKPFDDADRLLAQRLAALYGYTHQMLALRPKRAKERSARGRKWMWRGLIAAAVLTILCVPVPLTVSAPAEVTPRDPFIVTSSLDGVIEDIFVRESQPVQIGDRLVKLDTTALENRFDVAKNAFEVADARVRQLQQKSLIGAEESEDLELFEIERQLKQVETNYARSLIARANVSAEIAGQVIIGNRNDLVGSPVVVGQKILTIADPSKVEVTIALSASDLLSFEKGTPVELYLDAEPFKSYAATIDHISYEATPREGGAYAHDVIASLKTSDLPRFGARGVAKVRGDTVPLAVHLFRRPITAIRQWLGM
ncbi:MAG: HlyD family efflux transporter periplasmic adaptor subunit [Pseudomonadota bacterium]